MAKLSSLVALEVVLMTTYGDTNDEKVGIMTTFGFQCMHTVCALLLLLLLLLYTGTGRVYSLSLLKRKCLYFDHIFNITCIRNWRNDKFLCSWWWIFHQNGDIFFTIFRDYLIVTCPSPSVAIPWLILGLRPANERRCYKVTPSLIGWAQS